MTDEGLTALSVEMNTKASAPCSPANRPVTSVPRMLFFTASQEFHSIMGTCLCAAPLRNLHDAFSGWRLPRCRPMIHSCYSNRSE